MLVRNTLLYLPAQVIGPLFQLVSVIVWTHVASETTLGVVTLVTASHELLQALLLFWWAQYALRFFGSFQSHEDAARFYRSENAIIVISIALQSLGAMAVLRTEIAPGAGVGLSIAVIAYVATRSGNLYLAERARACHHVAVYTIQQIVGPAGGFVVGLLLIRRYGDAPEWPIAGYAVAQAVAALAAFPLMRFGWAIGPIDRAIFRQALRYGMPLVLGGGLTWVSVNASRFVVGHLLGVAAAGLFAVGYGLGWRASIFAAMLVTAGAFPIAVKRMREGGSRAALRQLSDNGVLLAAVVLPSVVGVYALRYEIVGLLIAPAFQPATLAILPLAAFAGAVRNFRSHFADQVFLLHERTRPLVMINGLEAAMTVVMSIVFAYRWGLVGAVAANAAAAVIAATLSFAFGIGLFGLRLQWAHLARIVVATAVMALALRIAPTHVTVPILTLHIVLGAAVYAVVLAALYGRELRARWVGRLKEPLPADPRV